MLNSTEFLVRSCDTLGCLIIFNYSVFKGHLVKVLVIRVNEKAVLDF